ncbi:toxin glutamine deamidase domain-containing protein [Streptomyces avicenniae]|uniref:toxin glutamine deamidase domain-containing protein n=1 Tax=Streptomyces avicenniae TaxID=500153 RepID=UPI00167E1348|nr:toxin glutamine deamidase domain-containing protein [Streptomyces avicenniae]
MVASADRLIAEGVSDVARPYDWSPVGMDSDPTPGDPDEVRNLAEELQEFSDTVDEALGRVRGLASDRAMQDWAGLSAEAFRSEFDGVPGNLTKLRDSYDLCAQALQTYWPRLQTAQGQADRALDRAIAAQADLASAQGSLGDAQSWVSRAGDEAERLQREGERDNAPPPDEADVRAATRDRQAADAAREAAQARVDAAQDSLDAARELARQAREMREEAAREAARDIDEASDAGIQNRKWWQDAVHWVTENWDTIVDVCKVIVAVLGVVVMIIGGPLALIVLAAALVVLADTLIDYAQGRATLWDVAFAALDCIPGMKGLTTLGGLARGLRGGIRAARGGLRSLAAAVRRAPTRPGATPLPPQQPSLPPAIHAQSMHPADAQRFIDTNYPWLREVNNTGRPGYTQNCTNCVVAVDRRLDGVTVSAAPLPGPRPVNQRALGAEGMNYQWVRNYEEIGLDLARRGIGSRSIVYIARPDRTAHVFNAVNTPQGVVFLDGQSGQLAQLEVGLTAIGHLPYR